MNGTIEGQTGWKPKIEKMHISEDVTRAGDFINSEATIKLTPIVEVDSNASYKGEPTPFSISHEMKISSMGWGKNTFKFMAGEHKKDITVDQVK